jgi:hypothetical protein
MIMTTLNIANVMQMAAIAGAKAMESCSPSPMVVTDGKQKWFVPDGVCGFAWVNLYKIQGKKPRANSQLAKVLNTFGFEKNTYQRSFQLWISAGGQSMQKKEAYAHAFARVLCQNGIEAYPGSRLD